MDKVKKMKLGVRPDKIGVRVEFGDFKVIILNKETSQEDLATVKHATGKSLVVELAV